MTVGREQALLSDLEILDRLVAVDESCIFVSPLIDPAHQLGPSSLDLRVGSQLVTTRTISSTHVDLTTGGQQIRDQVSEYFEAQDVGHNGHFVLHPGQFALAATLEYIRLPSDIAARIEGRSSVGRLGLQVHATAGFVDPGFEGSLTFELINAGNLPVRFSPGFRLGQLCFFRVEGVQVPYMRRESSKYGALLGVQVTQVDRDPEVA